MESEEIPTRAQFSAKPETERWWEFLSCHVLTKKMRLSGYLSLFEKWQNAILRVSKHLLASTQQLADNVGVFLKNTLHLDLSEEKTLITHSKDKAHIGKIRGKYRIGKDFGVKYQTKKGMGNIVVLQPGIPPCGDTRSW